MNEETQVAPDGAEQPMTVDEQLRVTAIEFQRAIERITDLESKMDAGQLIGRPDAIVLHAARVAHEVNRAYCRGLGDNSQPPWGEAPEWQRKSALLGVRAIQANPGMTPAQQHALWRAQKVSDGWVYGDAKDVEKKTHPCLVPYDELPAEQQIKDVLFGAAVRAVLGV